MAAGQNLAAKFKELPDHRWELTLTKPITELAKGKLTVSVKDGQGNLTRIVRTFSVTKGNAADVPADKPRVLAIPPR